MNYYHLECRAYVDSVTNSRCLNKGYITAETLQDALKLADTLVTHRRLKDDEWCDFAGCMIKQSKKQSWDDHIAYSAMLREIDFEDIETFSLTPYPTPE